MHEGQPRPDVDVVDAHVHIFSREIIEHRNRRREGDVWFASLYAEQTSLLVDVDDLIGSMDAAGIVRSVLCGFPWRDEGMCREHNAIMAEAVERFPGRLDWLGVVNPADPAAPRDLTDALATGAVGLGELNADAQGFDLDDGGLAVVAEICRGAEVSLLLHASEPVGHDYPGKGTATPDRLLRALRDLQDNDVVLAHWGGGLPFFELMPEVAELTRRVVYDSAASTYLYRFQVFRTVIDIVGGDRVLFASDYPILRQKRFLERVDAIGWRSHAEREAVLAGNARRWYAGKAASA